MAGRSSRLLPLTSGCHKVLLEIGGKSLVEHQLAAFKQVDITETVFVVGHQAELTRSKLGDCYQGIRIKYIFNPYYVTRNIDYSLYLAKDEVRQKDFIYMEADIFFHPHILKSIIDSSFDNCLVVDPNPQSAIVDTLVLGENNVVTGLMFKEHGDLSREIQENEEVVGEYIPLMKFSAEASRILFDELEQSSFEGPMRLPSIFERCFQIEGMNYIEAKGYPWVQIDNYDDLTKARKLYAHGLFR